MTKERLEKLGECSEKINDIMAELSAIQKAEEDYKNSIPTFLTDYDKMVDRATDNCANLRRCIFRLADCMADLEEFT